MMLCIDEQRKVFETFCAERYGENGCQTSKTIAREKGQSIIRLLRNDLVAEAYIRATYNCYRNCLHNCSFVRYLNAILRLRTELRNLKIA